MSTDALELALALHQAPIQRFALRDRPLPANMDEVLQLASAMQPQLGAAAARFSESEETIVEAVRFYLHQVLFEPGTDAYRIFGVAPNADYKQVRQRHIWLQRWLHPDRRGEDWEAALATKVNWAWQQLRNESSRKEYDRSRQHSVAQSAPDSTAMAHLQVPAWSAEPVEPTRHWLRWVVMGSLLSVCVALFYLAATRQDRVDPDVLASHSSDADSGIRARLPFINDSRPRMQEPVSSPDAATSAPSVADSDLPQAPAESQTEPSALPAPVGANPDPNGVEPEPLAGTTGESTPVLPVEAPGDSRSESSVQRLALKPVVPEAIAPSSSQERIADQAPNIPTRRESAAPEKPVPVRVAAQAPAVSQVSARNLKRASSADSRQAGGSHRIARTDTGSPTHAAGTPDVRVAPAAAQTEWQPAQLSSSDEKHDEAALAQAAPRSVQRDAELAPADTLLRFELARKRLSAMVSYLRSTNGEPPNWHDDQGQRSAARERDALHARSGGSGIDRFELDSPQWRVTGTAVAMNTAYQVSNGRSIAETGRLRLDMAWRDGSWKTVRFEVLPTQ